MKKIIYPALVSFRENISRNMFGVNLFYLAFMIVFLVFVQDMRDEYGKYEFFVDGARFIKQLFVIFFAVACTFPLFESDKSSNRLFVLLSSHLSRRDYLIGKYLGAFISVFANYAVLCLVLSLVSWFSFSKHPYYLLGIYLSGAFELALLTAFAFFFSITMTRFMGLMMFFFVYITGHFTYYVQYYTSSGKAAYSDLLSTVYAALPNFEYFALHNAYFSGRVIPDGYFFFLFFYTIGWLALLFVVSEILFSRRDF